MGKKKCSVEGCEKQSWVDGLCHRHYIEMRGEYVPKKKYPPRTKQATKDPVPEIKRAPGETKTRKPETKSRKKPPIVPGGLNAGVLDRGGEPPCLEPGDTAVIVKFTGCDQLLEDLRALAKKEFRDIDAQILYIIDQYLKMPVLDGHAAPLTGRIEEFSVNSEERVASLWLDAFNRNVCGLEAYWGPKVHKVLYAVFDRKKGILKRSSKKGKVLNFFAAQPLGTRKHLLIAEREISPGRDYWRWIHV